MTVDLFWLCVIRSLLTIIHTKEVAECCGGDGAQKSEKKKGKERGIKKVDE